MKSISTETRKAISTIIQAGESMKNTSKSLNLSVGTISKYKNIDSPSIISGPPGRKNIFSSKEKNLIKKNF